MEILLNINEAGNANSINILESDGIINEVSLVVGIQKDGVNGEHRIVLDVNTGSTSIAHKQGITPAKQPIPKASSNHSMSTANKAHSILAATNSAEEAAGSIIPDIQTAQKNEQNKQFFLALPTEDGVFDANNIDYEQSENYPFEIFIDARNSNEALFILETTKLSKLLENKSKNINSVCEIENLNTNPISIECIEDGVARLENGQWKVTKKTKVRYN